MKQKHCVIIIPGLGDGTKGLKIATANWDEYNLEPIIYSVEWKNDTESFHTKKEKLLNKIDTLINDGCRVSLIGTSAGASIALNAFIERRDQIHKVVNVCGRLKVGPTSGFRSFKSKTAKSNAFAQSVINFRQKEPSLAINDRKRIMTIRAMFGDELVPSETIPVDGAKNIQIPTAEHVLSITAAMTIFSNNIIRFLK